MKAVSKTAIKLAAVKMAILDEALKGAGEPLGGTIEQKVSRLQGWYAKNADPKTIADCSTCGGESPVTVPRCPFCGDGDLDFGTPAPVAGTSGKLAQQTLPVAPPPRPSPKVPVPVASVPPPLVPSSTLLMPGTGQALVRKDRETPSAKALVPKPPEAVAEVIEASKTEADLDRTVARIKALMGQAADSLWEVGRLMVELHDQNLWRLRQKVDGGSRYVAWGQFCEEEFGFSHSYSIKLMDVAREFSREQVATIGPSKLYITLQVPKEFRQRLIEEAEGGATREEIEESAKEIGKTKRLLPEESGKSGSGGGGTHKPGGKPAGRPPEKITVAMLTTRVELYPVTQKGTRLKLRLPGPVAAEERLFNGVKQRIVLTNDDEGALVFFVERVRE